MSITADVVVVGGGITGCSTAFHLASGGMRVILLERRVLASGPTGVSPAILRQHYADAAVALLARISLNLFRQWREESGCDYGFVQTGFLTGVASSELAALQTNISIQRQLGLEIDFLAIDEVRGLLPDFVPDGLVGGVYEPGAGYCDPVATTSALITAAGRLGCLTIQNCAAERIRISGGHVTGVETSMGSIDAPVVVNAAGPWAAQLATASGMELPILTTRHAVAVVEMPVTLSLPGLSAYAERSTSFYLRPSAGNLCLIGSLDPADSHQALSDEYDATMTEEEMLKYQFRAGRRFERIMNARLRTGWASLFDTTPDGNPLIGTDARAEGSFIAAGLSGHGFKFFPVFGRGIADMVINGRTDLPLDIFAVERFARHRPTAAAVA